MKKLLLILLCVPLIGFGQFQYKLDSVDLDYLKIYFNYDQDGRCIQSTAGMDNTLNNYIYDLNNNIQQIFHRAHNWYTDEFDTIAINYLSYDNNNNLVQEELYPFVSYSNFNTILINYTYDIDNNLILQEREEILSAYASREWIYEYLYQNSELVTVNRYFKTSTMSSYDTVVNHFTYLNGDVLTDTVYINGIAGTNEYIYNTMLVSNTAFPKFNIWDCIEGVAGIAPNNYSYLNRQPSEIIWDYPNNSSTISTLFYYSILPATSIQEHTTNKELLKVTDILGRESNEKRNTPLFYIYNDGTVEKKIIIE